MENKLNELTDAIRKALPRLMEIENGQIFNSKYYGLIQATQIEIHKANIYSIYGFDFKCGLPRSNYYPRELELIGKEPQLNDVLEWLDIIDKENNYIIDVSGMVFIFYNNEMKPKCIWDLSKPYLKNQSEDLINFLHSLNQNSHE